MSILAHLRQREFAEALDELSDLKRECANDPSNVSLMAAHADLTACCAFYASKAEAEALARGEYGP